MTEAIKVHREGETAGIRWQIVSGVTPGYRWRVLIATHHLGDLRWKESQGAFYDDCDDHPEGGEEWAAAAVQKYLARTP